MIIRCILCGVNGLVNKIDVNTARPRNSKSPNFNAYDSIKTLTSSPTTKCEYSKFPVKAKTLVNNQYKNPCFPSFVSESPSILTEKPNYFSLSKFNHETKVKVSHTVRADNFVKRFSHQLIVDNPTKTVIESHKKRFSMGDNGVIVSQFKRNK